MQVKGAADEPADLAAAIDGVGPGRSVAAKVAAVQDDLAEGDVNGACTALAEFGHEVDAQAGKKARTTRTGAPRAG